MSTINADARSFADLVIAAETCRDDGQTGVSFLRQNMRRRDDLMHRVMAEVGPEGWTEVVEAARPIIAATLRGMAELTHDDQ